MKWPRCLLWGCPGPNGKKERPSIAKYAVRWLRANDHWTPVCEYCKMELEGPQYMDYPPQIVPLGISITKVKS